MSPGIAPFTATGPVQMCTPSPSPAPRPNSVGCIGPAPRRSTPLRCLSQKNTLSAPGSPVTIRSASSLAWCVSDSMVTKSPELISTSGFSSLLKYPQCTVLSLAGT